MIDHRGTQTPRTYGQRLVARQRIDDFLKQMALRVAVHAVDESVRLVLRFEQIAHQRGNGARRVAAGENVRRRMSALVPNARQLPASAHRPLSPTLCHDRHPRPPTRVRHRFCLDQDRTAPSSRFSSSACGARSGNLLLTALVPDMRVHDSVLRVPQAADAHGPNEMVGRALGFELGEIRGRYPRV